MVRKPAKMYRKISGPAYTRREYITAIPNPRIVHFELGNKEAKDEFPVELSLIAEESCQIRHIALEAARVVSTRHMNKYVGSMNYYLKVRVYPHHVLREHKMATGAGADRISSGMSKAFGKPVGTAARVKEGDVVMLIRVNPNAVKQAKEALRKAAMKLPTPCRIVITKGAEYCK